jgi:hypothetical protein
MTTMVERMLELADQLITDRPRSAAFRRRAVSTAYYAVFHQISKICSEEIASEHEPSSTQYVRVYRSLDHAAIKAVLNEQSLKKSDRIRRIGESFALLQSERNRADYWPPVSSEFPVRRVRELIATAREAVAELNSLGPTDRQTLVVHLLVKDKAR